MLTETEKRKRLRIGREVLKALDGRTRIWLCEKTGMPPDYLSNKIRGRKDFTQVEIDQINAILNTNIIL